MYFAGWPYSSLSPGVCSDGCRYIRHPGYLGFLLWCVGTQLLLVNPASCIIFAVVVRAVHYWLCTLIAQSYLMPMCCDVTSLAILMLYLKTLPSTGLEVLQGAH